MEAFTSCTLNDNQDSDWYTDTGATTHMTNDATQLDKSNTYTGKDRVIVGNGASFPISHTDTISPTSSLTLKDVLVMPGLTKNLISISKLTSDFPFSITFTNDRFIIQNQVTRRVVVTGQRENGLYVLERGHQSLISVLSNNCPQASFDVWHAHLGHVSHSIISLFNKNRQLCVTSLLPTPTICSCCQLAKSHRLPFQHNEKRASHVLDLIHCDLWGPSPVPSNLGYKYYVIFVDDHSRFTWLYPLKLKSYFYHTFLQFQKFVGSVFS